MIKFLGSVMIICSGVGIGMAMSQRNKKHLHTVEAVEKMFCETKLMLQFNALTFAELISYLQKSSQTSSMKFLKVDAGSVSIRDDIISSVRENKDALTDQETAKLESFFAQLGETDIDGQISLANRYAEFFCDDLDNLRSESSAKCKLYNSLGALGGAFLAILLV